MATGINGQKITVHAKAVVLASGGFGANTKEVTSWTENIVMGGVNGYAISAYTKHREASLEFVNFASSYELVKVRAEMLGIAPTRSDVAEVTGDTSTVIFNSLKEGRIELMPSIKAVNQIWTPIQSMLSDVAKDAFREKNNETVKYADLESCQAALDQTSQNIYDAIYTLTDH